MKRGIAYVWWALIGAQGHIRRGALCDEQHEVTRASHVPKPCFLRSRLLGGGFLQRIKRPMT